MPNDQTKIASNTKTKYQTNNENICHRKPMKTPVHLAVLAKKSAKLLIADKNGTYLDATLGLGGHSKYFSALLANEGKIIAIDTDSDSLQIAKNNLKNKKNIIIKYANFADIKEVLKETKINMLSGAFFDLGLSSYHLESSERGFAFSKEGPLDMRFDTTGTATAKEIINNSTYEKLKKIISLYGEEKFAGKIASEIIRKRLTHPIETTTQLKNLIEKIIKRRGKIHPATRTFQALRIAVNSELENIEKALENIQSFISAGGRIVVISYHSLEDRLVKRFFKKLAGTKKWVILTKKPEVADKLEVSANPRSRSAKLRAIERRQKNV